MSALLPEIKNLPQAKKEIEMNRREFMKNALTLASVAAFGLGRSEEVNARETSAPRSSSGNEGDKNMKCAVVYFSWGGNTRFAAETIAKKVRADIFEIKAETPYNSDFNKCCDEAKPECYGKKLRAIKPVEGLDLAKYDFAFVGSPNWWGTIAPPVRTWITQNAAALKGKTMCLFQTHGGGGMQSLGRDFAALLPDSKVLAPKAFSGSSIKSNVKALEDFADERIAGK